ncbi:Cyclopropane-fatty-acyl-phospholipid synthase superfamily [Synechococcus sp. PCC 7335]|uniref:SAM-dependent methyltransferase n=1 Tax=Synechococcus sp. (strain ATCC 29403 / PCC 7335) TaxID=91464 RepID=UPI00017ED1C6|nr:class I SAM-dependent methyltransferase [Synechococcus sp. PCC 7335]EDX87525.1 Cyclopropane-fatty-acyl-phospholipid synthase superfamily [Synechococcus sp. PCC 7335]
MALAKESKRLDTTNFSTKQAPVKRSISYRTTRAVSRIFNAAQMGFAEAYINGLEVPDSVIRSTIQASMPIFFRYFPGLLAPYEWVLTETDRMAEGSQDLMKLQYDLPQPMLNQMLGNWEVIYPKYSAGLWERGAKDLKESQMHMIDQVIERLDIQDGDHILDCGCGWGCVPNYILSKFPNVRFTGLNLSHEQCEFMRNKMKDAKSYLSSGRFTLCEGDLNKAEFKEKFDKVLTLGLFEHVGNLTLAFENLASLIKDNGKIFIHIITVRTPNNMSSGFTHKYIFPHGRYWNYDAVPNCNHDLKTVQRWYMNGMNYHKTLTVWLDRFDASHDTVKDLDYGMDYPKFRRMWRLYLLMLGTIFGTCDGEYNGNGQFLLEKA